MNFIDLWAIITGLASIISLLIAIYDKFPKWNKYILSIGFLLAGFSVGRIFTGNFPQNSDLTFDPILIGFLAIIFILLIVAFGFFYMLIKKNQMNWAYAFVMVFIMIVGPMLTDRYLEYFSLVPKVDYLVLANIKERNNDIPAAIKYL
ncbi:MAG: hypothetical protein ACOZFS_00365 [Thermodesulfobacteriota bacterium]